MLYTHARKFFATLFIIATILFLSGQSFASEEQSAEQSGAAAEQSAADEKPGYDELVETFLARGATQEEAEAFWAEQAKALTWFHDWQTVFDSVLASHKLGSVSGIITLDVVEPGRVVGSFAGYMAEPDGVQVVVTEASFSAGAGILPVESASWSRIKAIYRN